MENADAIETVVYSGEPAPGRWKGKGKLTTVQEDKQPLKPESSMPLLKSASSQATNVGFAERNSSFRGQSDASVQICEVEMPPMPASLISSGEREFSRGRPDDWAKLNIDAHWRMFMSSSQQIDNDQTTVSDSDGTISGDDDTEMIEAAHILLSLRNAGMDRTEVSSATPPQVEPGDEEILRRVRRVLEQGDEGAITIRYLKKWLRERGLQIGGPKKVAAERVRDYLMSIMRE